MDTEFLFLDQSELFFPFISFFFFFEKIKEENSGSKHLLTLVYYPQLWFYQLVKGEKNAEK
jgi:hypothetical protein